MDFELSADQARFVADVQEFARTRVAPRAANQQTIGRADGDGYRLQGEKVWVANAQTASLVLVFAATRPGEGGRGISAFLVPIDAPGLTRVASPDSLGVRGLGCMNLQL